MIVELDGGCAAVCVTAPEMVGCPPSMCGPCLKISMPSTLERKFFAGTLWKSCSAVDDTEIFGDTPRMSSTQKLLADIESFISKRNMNAGTFGAMAVGDWSLVKRLRAGKTVTLETADAIRLFMRTYKSRVVRGNGRRGGDLRVSAA